MKISITIVVLLIIASVLFSSCDKKSDTVTKTELLLGTFAKITLFDISETEGAEIIKKAFALIRDYEMMFSASIDGSEISHINSAAHTWTEVSDDTLELIKLAIYYEDLSGGLLDPTIGSVSSLWDFTGSAALSPAQEDIDFALEGVGIENIQISGNAVRLVNPVTKMDLGSIAKGFIADKTALYLQSEGVTGAVIDLGGDIKTVGQKQSGSWNIGIQAPYAGSSELLGVLTVGEMAVVTSGIYERFFYQDGNLYHHILDPDTGYPVESDLISVTVICDSAADGDALSTAAFLAGSEAGMSLIERLPGTEAVFVLKNGDITSTSGIGGSIPFNIAETAID